MPYNETFEKLKAAQNPAFAEEIEAVKDNQTFFIGAYESSPEGNIPKGDFNEIFQALLNNDKALKILAEAIQARTITAGKGLQGGGNLAANRTIDVVSADDSITVGADNIKVNTYDGVDSTSVTRPGSANAVKQAYDKGKEGLDKANTKLDAGSVSVDYNTGKKIEDKIKGLDSSKQNKTDNELQTNAKEIVPAINESLWTTRNKELTNGTDLNLVRTDGFYYSNPYAYKYPNEPDGNNGNFVLRVMSSDINQINESGWKTQILHNPTLRKTWVRYIDYVSNGWSKWGEVVTTISNSYLGVLGITGISYIQTSGDKTRNQLYVDNVTGKLYICYPIDSSVDIVSDVTVTENFILATNLDIAKKIIGLGDYFNLSNNKNSSRGIELLQLPSKSQELRIKIKSKGIYYVVCSCWAGSDETLALKRNNEMIARVPTFSSSFPENPGSLNYVGIFEKDDIISMRFTAGQWYVDVDNSFSIVKIQNI